MELTSTTFATVVSVDNEVAPNISSGDIIVKVDERYFRPAEVETLLGDPSYAASQLGWIPEISVEEICKEVVAEDLKIAKGGSFTSRKFASRSIGDSL